MLGGYATGRYSSPGPMMLQVNVQGQGGGAIRCRPGRDAGVCAAAMVKRGSRELRAASEFGADSAAGIGGMVAIKGDVRLADPRGVLLRTFWSMGHSSWMAVRSGDHKGG